MNHEYPHRDDANGNGGSDKVRYKEHLPHVSLQDHVTCFWIMEREYTPEHPAEDVTPDAFIELILNFGDPYVLHAEGVPDREMPRAILVGLQQKPLLFRCRGTVKLVATRFHAWGALPFLADRARGLNKLATTLGTEWDDLAKKVEPAVLADDYDAAVAIVEDHLIERLLTATVDLKKIKAAAQMLHLQKGQFRIAELAEHCNLSSRQLQRQFQDAVGVSPKTLARAIRFEEIRKRLMFDPDQSLTMLAHEYGYTDQAHFIHDFREFAGRTPGELAREMRAIQDIFRDHDNVVFLQVPPRGHR
ncbi:MAG TPA: helix-turn-helix domain-containing protein [Thermoanaerobaculia bacterium]|nr:helix-turn-helix domain-containing protein [Thermoanaerobaculia bacterium]